jgi:hypothetical protein
MYVYIYVHVYIYTASYTHTYIFAHIKYLWKDRQDLNRFFPEKELYSREMGIEGKY